MYKRILLTLDGSALAEQALPHALAQGERFGAELVLLRVLEPLAESGGVPREAVKRAEKQTRAMAHEYLEDVAAAPRRRGIPTQTVTLEGRPHEAIVRFVETSEVDLIVLSDHGRSGLTRWLVGSVADRVLRGAGVPVLLVRVGNKGKAGGQS